MYSSLVSASGFVEIKIKIPLLIDAAEAKATRHNNSKIDCLILVTYPMLSFKDQMINDTWSAWIPLYKGVMCMYLSD